MTSTTTPVKSLKSLISRSAAHNPDDLVTFAGYEFNQGMVYADMQWLNTFVHYLADCELEAENIVGITGLDMDRVIDIIIRNDLKMGAPVW